MFHASCSSYSFACLYISIIDFYKYGSRNLQDFTDMVFVARKNLVLSEKSIENFRNITFSFHALVLQSKKEFGLK